jgi:hypothetical protein
MMREPDTIEWEGGRVSGVWHHPDGRTGPYVLLGHGAGGNMHTPQLVGVGDALAARGIGALRFNFAYMEEKRKAPDPPRRLEACYRAAAEHAAGRVERLFVGGRSLGGRMASHIVAAGFPAAGLVFLAYPLHKPGKTDQLRDAHLYTIEPPMLFIQGTRDSFARFDLLTETVSKLPGATLHVIEDGDHGLKVPRRSPAEVVEEIADVTASWVAKAGP